MRLRGDRSSTPRAGDHAYSLTKSPRDHRGRNRKLMTMKKSAQETADVKPEPGTPVPPAQGCESAADQAQWITVVRLNVVRRFKRDGQNFVEES